MSLFRKNRIAAALSQEEIADIMGCTQAYVSMIEQIKREPSAEHLDRLEAELGWTAGDLGFRLEAGTPRVVRK